MPQHPPNPEGLALVNAGIDGFVSTGGLQHVPFLKLSLVEGHYLNGDMAEALGALEEIRDLVERTDQRFYEPEMHRQRGIVLEVIGRTDEAAAAFREAIAVADGQGSVSWRDRAKENLALLNARN